MQLNSKLIRATLTGALGGLLFGFDTVVISGAIDALVRLYGLSPQDKGFTVAIGLVGTVIGALGAGQIGQKLGGRETLRITAVLYVVSAAGLRAGLELARRSWSSASSAGWASAHRRCWGRSTLRSWPRPSGAAAWWPPSSSTWSSASCWPTRRTTRFAPCTWARPSGAGRWASRRSRQLVFLVAALRHSAQPALVGLEESHRRSAGRAEDDGRTGPGGRAGRHSQPPWRRSTPRRTSRSSSGSTAIRCFWPSPSAHSTSWPASTPFSIT